MTEELSTVLPHTLIGIALLHRMPDPVPPNFAAHCERDPQHGSMLLIVALRSLTLGGTSGGTLVEPDAICDAHARGRRSRTNRLGVEPDAICDAHASALRHRVLPDELSNSHGQQACTQNQSTLASSGTRGIRGT